MTKVQAADRPRALKCKTNLQRKKPSIKLWTINGFIREFLNLDIFALTPAAVVFAAVAAPTRRASSASNGEECQNSRVRGRTVRRLLVAATEASRNGMLTLPQRRRDAPPVLSPRGLGSHGWSSEANRFRGVDNRLAPLAHEIQGHGGGGWMERVQ